MPHKPLIEEYLAAFRASDTTRVLACLADDVVWDVPGQARFEGKAAFGAQILDPRFEPNPDIRVEKMVEEGDVVIAEGTVRTVSRFGEVYRLAFCDVFEIRGGKIGRLVSYLSTLSRPDSDD